MKHLRRINAQIRHKLSEKGIKFGHPIWFSTTSYSLYSSYLGGTYRTAQPYLQDKTKPQSVGYRQRPQPIPPENNWQQGRNHS
jgi:hypothetical protein